MNIVVKARHMEATNAIRQYAETKAAKLSRFYDGVVSIEVILDVEADRPVVETIVTGKKKSTFVATHRGQDMYACVDQCLHKIREQLRRFKDKVRDRQGPSHDERSQRGAP